jgi:hypothetical protein
MTTRGFSAAMYYLAAYYLMNLGAFGFLLYFEGVTGSETRRQPEGMGWKAPVVSCTMVAFLISLTASRRRSASTASTCSSSRLERDLGWLVLSRR